MQASRYSQRNGYRRLQAGHARTEHVRSLIILLSLTGGGTALQGTREACQALRWGLLCAWEACHRGGGLERVVGRATTHLPTLRGRIWCSPIIQVTRRPIAHRAHQRVKIALFEDRLHATAVPLPEHAAKQRGSIDGQGWQLVAVQRRTPPHTRSQPGTKEQHHTKKCSICTLPRCTLPRCPPIAPRWGLPRASLARPGSHRCSCPRRCTPAAAPKTAYNTQV